ncbi:hypothetical protein U732_2940 [Clostridium argentinense CDC 2741]|uniref:Uncharacterized protein n=1 Tax=Clostridium argentinense CDC 2741 TaxID=1418104 RepID=A0A0C1U4C7_9CLOT|nr:hypothetical protein [Clostridium argentinense]KIE47644.1 hypothetical protein U732_2940 [Clostridium argentinense CDC 2741]
MLYNLLKNLINAKRFEKEDMTNKLNVFFTFNQLEVEQYQELLEKVNVQ